MNIGRIALIAAASMVTIVSTGRLVSAREPALLTYLDQGPQWSAGDRTRFYTTDQGSEIMPLAWARALIGPDGAPFLAGQLTRYGYIAGAPTDELPVGFTAGSRNNIPYLGMTCAACHTRELAIDGQRYRIDGGPALSDFQSFLTDLDRAVGKVLTSDAAFEPFADHVLGVNSTAAAQATLKRDVAAWYQRQHTLFAAALPTEPWGVGRLDAVSMILNRVSGLDIGTTANRLIPGNINPADAPVRYPFIWDAPKQDRTQWPGFADNGDVVLAVARNLGEVYGVFADFHPVKDNSPLGYDFLSQNSANFAGLDQLERLVRKIKAPVWPWPTQPDRVARGQALFEQQCTSCHGITPGALRLLPMTQAWKTPLLDVGTDTHEYDILARLGDTGVLRGARYGLTQRLGARDRQFNILAASVVGSMIDRFAHHGLPIDSLIQPIHFGQPLPPLPTTATASGELRGAYHPEIAEQATGDGTHRYEARVLHGIWATAPYLHNGTVASLAELLTRPEDRKVSFAIGPAFDRDVVGLASAQPGTPHIRRTSGCDNLQSGNSHCGHRYGTDLSTNQKQDLLEYLKTY